MRTQLSEIEWLDKVQKNFSSCGHCAECRNGSMACSQINNYDNPYNTGYQGYGTLTTGGSLSGSVMVSGGDYTLSTTAAGRVEQVTDMMETGIISNAQAENLLFGSDYPPYNLVAIRNTTGPINVRDANGNWYACSLTGELCSVTFEDGQTFSTNSTSFRRLR